MVGKVFPSFVDVVAKGAWPACPGGVELNEPLLVVLHLRLHFVSNQLFKQVNVHFDHILTLSLLTKNFGGE